MNKRDAIKAEIKRINDAAHALNSAVEIARQDYDKQKELTEKEDFAEQTKRVKELQKTIDKMEKEIRKLEIQGRMKYVIGGDYGFTVSQISEEVVVKLKAKIKNFNKLDKIDRIKIVEKLIELDPLTKQAEKMEAEKDKLEDELYKLEEKIEHDIDHHYMVEPFRKKYLSIKNHREELFRDAQDLQRELYTCIVEKPKVKVVVPSDRKIKKLAKEMGI